MNTADKKVSLEIPLNTQMKIFAFLFKENYSMSELILGTHTVGYYGKSQSFSISTNTNSLSLGITLKAASGNEDDSNGGGGDQGGTDTTAPVIAEVYPVTTPTSDSTPDYTFSSTKDGTISYGGSCSSNTTYAISGNNTITFNALSDDTYYNCTITVKDSAGNVSNTLTIPHFTVDTTVPDTTAPTVTFSPANGATGVAISDNIIITFSEAVRNIDNTVLTDSNIDNLITLKLTNASGANITFDATIDTNKKVITINPISNLFYSQAVYVAIGATVEDSADHVITVANATFTTGGSGDYGGTDTTAPTVTFSPVNGATGVAISDNIIITFSEAVRNIDNTMLTDSNIDSLITLKLTNAIGANITFDATIDANKKVITIDPTNNLPNS
ncbi:MAG: Ig-like domain-containing protein, partial [Gammaproteobacteria bacterium]|nr:Ig-like domain-containing protein [Gammaproteobacteria bacterium]